MHFNQKRIIQIECLVAFAHSRIIGLASTYDDKLEKVFKNDKAENEAILSNKELSECIKDLSTVEIIQDKIDNSSPLLSNMYYYWYSKASKLMDKIFPNGAEIIEALIGMHLLRLLTENNLIGNGVDNLDYYNYVISIYENDDYTSSEDMKKVVKDMKIATTVMFNLYMGNKIKKKRRKDEL